MRKRRTGTLTFLACVVTAVAAAGCSSGTATPAPHVPKRSAPTTTSTTAAPPSATPTTVPLPTEAAQGWSGVLTTLPPGGGFTSLSCISDTFCVAAGGGDNPTGSSLTAESGVAVSWDGATWSDPGVYYPDPSTGPVTAPVLPAVSCTRGPTCVIADGSGHLSTGDGTDWSVPTPFPATPPLPVDPDDTGGARSAAVSCPNSSFCAVVDNTGQALALRDGKWVAAQSFGRQRGSGPGATTVALYQEGRNGVSCPSPTDCTAVIGDTVLDWNGVSWTEESAPWTPSTVTVTSPTAISCPTPSLCVVAHGTSVSMRTGGQAWTPGTAVDERESLDAVSCPTATFCVAVDTGGSVVQWNGSAWTSPHQVVPAASDYQGIGTSVSCPTAQFCMVVNADGDYATYTGNTAL